MLEAEGNMPGKSTSIWVIVARIIVIPMSAGVCGFCAAWLMIFFLFDFIVWLDLSVLSSLAILVFSVLFILGSAVFGGWGGELMIRSWFSPKKKRGQKLVAQQA